jgi:hypothetical protein
MNFILVLSVCSFVTANCFITAESKHTYPTWQECVNDAMHKSQILMETIPIEQINEFKLATTYSCYEQEKTKT